MSKLIKGLQRLETVVVACFVISCISIYSAFLSCKDVVTRRKKLEEPDSHYPFEH